MTPLLDPQEKGSDGYILCKARNVTFVRGISVPLPISRDIGVQRCIPSHPAEGPSFGAATSRPSFGFVMAEFPVPEVCTTTVRSIDVSRG